MRWNNKAQVLNKFMYIRESFCVYSFKGTKCYYNIVILFFVKNERIANSEWQVFYARREISLQNSRRFELVTIEPKYNNNYYYYYWHFIYSKYIKYCFNTSQRQQIIATIATIAERRENNWITWKSKCNCIYTREKKIWTHSHLDCELHVVEVEPVQK